MFATIATNHHRRTLQESSLADGFCSAPDDGGERALPSPCDPTTVHVLPCQTRCVMTPSSDERCLHSDVGQFRDEEALGSLPLDAFTATIIALGRGHIGMPSQPLHGRDIGAGIQQVADIRPASAVRTGAFHSLQMEQRTALATGAGPVHMLFTGRCLSVAGLVSCSVKAVAALASSSGCACGSRDFALPVAHWNVTGREFPV